MLNNHRKKRCVGLSSLTASLAFVLVLNTSCTRFGSKKSTLRDLQQGEQETALSPKQMKIKFSFTFIGSGGQKYPVYMNADLQLKNEFKEATWNSQIDSDGGLVSAVNESKTLKPDKNLILKSSANITDSNQEVSLTSGNPEIGRGLALTLKKVVVSGRLVWRAVGLSYFGYDAQIEDSFFPSTASTDPTHQLR